MKYVKQMTIQPRMTVGQLVEEMNGCGVLGAGRLARAVDVLSEMFEDQEYTNFLSLAGPLVPGGLRKIISLLIERGYVDAVVTSGANIVHDIVEALGCRGIQGSYMADDVELRAEGVGRAGDIYFEQQGFEALEKRVYEVFDNLPEERKTRIAVYELLAEIGKRLDDEESFLKTAAVHNVPVFSPGITDSMLGMHIWTYNQLKKLWVDPVLDLNRMADLVFTSKKSGAIILGGGTPKHHVLGANILREGVDAAVQVILDRPEGGSLSGAPLEEAISWKKAQTESKLVTVVGDATIIFPVMVAATLERLDGRERDY